VCKGLDFVSSIKLVNYIRTEVANGNQKPDLSSRELFQDDKYLTPVLEDDAVLYSLDDIDSNGEDVFETKLDQKDALIADLRDELTRVKSHFSAYRKEVQKDLRSQLGDDLWDEEETSDPNLGFASTPSNEEGKSKDTQDSGYFTSYSYNSIHESMLKDTVRTDAYRDFVYDNKNLFKGRIVLDVGCGTGILSMFCAKAGAKRVIAVDNSDIIGKARENIFENGLQDTVTCVRGKIEEVAMPVEEVDVIVSEWMGYCLLYESMLDSVLYARDKYLRKDGLMVPSHAVLRIAPTADSELVASHVDFWKEVYGFKMTSMLEKVYDEALIRSVEPSDLAADGAVFLELDLHKATVDDLTFTSQFQLTWKEGFGHLDGFVIWFDIYFARSRKEVAHIDWTIPTVSEKGMVAFTTGPGAMQTHWQQGALLIKGGLEKVNQGDILAGSVGYRKKKGRERSLDIEIEWSTPSVVKRRRQIWSVD